MKVNLVVATGAHQGKVIALTGPQFLIGRDPECQLRPASQAVSKQHCAITVRDGNVYLTDFGSTNGSVLNGTIVRGEERQLKTGDSLQVGPLDFIVRVEVQPPKEDGTPLPGMNAEAAAAIAAVKAASRNTPPGRDPTPAPSRPSPSGVVSKSAVSRPGAGQSGSRESPALPSTPAAKPEERKPDAPVSAEDHDRIAAMMLGLADNGEVPEGSTVVDMPAVPPEGAAGAAKPEEKKDPKKMPTKEDTSNAASEILRKYMRRPK